MDPPYNLNLHSNDLVNHNVPTCMSTRQQDQHSSGTSLRNHGDQQQHLVSALIDDRGDNLLSSFLGTHSGPELPGSNDNGFLLGSDHFNNMTTGQLLMEPTVNKYSYDAGPRESSPSKIETSNCSPVKKALDKAKQSPFKKRGNFEEESFPKSDSKDYSHSELPKQLMSKMFGLLKEGMFCDAIILSGNTEIRIHRLVLLAACPFISSKMSDLSQNSSLKIELPMGIPLNVTSQLVHYLYDGKVTLTSDNVADFARVANLFKLTHLLDMCKDFTIMFGVNQTILQDKEEDIVAIVKTDSSTPTAIDQNKTAKIPVKRPAQKSRTKTVMKKCKNDKLSPEHIKDSIKDSDSIPATPTHSYGTRRASMKSYSKDLEEKSRTPLFLSEENMLESKKSTDFAPYKLKSDSLKPKHPIHTNEAFINSNKVGNEGRNKLFSSQNQCKMSSNSECIVSNKGASSKTISSNFSPMKLITQKMSEQSSGEKLMDEVGMVHNQNNGVSKQQKRPNVNSLQVRTSGVNNQPDRTNVNSLQVRTSGVNNQPDRINVNSLQVRTSGVNNQPDRTNVNSLQARTSVVNYEQSNCVKNNNDSTIVPSNYLKKTENIIKSKTVATRSQNMDIHQKFKDNIDEGDEEDDDEDDDYDPMENFTDDEDAEWKPNIKIKSRIFTKKGRAARAFKKSYAAYLKSKPKKTAVVEEQKETHTLRPPPKKRAKEYAHTDFEELEDILSKPVEKGIVHKYSMDPKSSPEEDKTALKKRGRLKKVNTYRASQLSSIAVKIEQKADHLQPNDRHFVCELCGNHYVFSKRAVTHIISVHDIDLEEITNVLSIRKKEKVLKMCDICGYETKESNFFYIHFHRYFRHGVPLPKGMEPFKCDICGKECFTRFQLKDHKLIHQEGIPFICETCGQGFNSRTCLTSHVFHKHSKVRNHKCTDYGCEKSFKTRTQLLVHMRSHSGEKPFQCPDCHYKSTTRGNMRLHLTNKHKHASSIVKNIMLNLKPTAGDEMVIDLGNDGDKFTKYLNDTVTETSERKTVYKNLPTSNGSEQILCSIVQTDCHGTQTAYENLQSQQESQVLCDSDQSTNLQQFSAQQSLILNNIPADQLELLPSDHNLHTVQNDQLLVPPDHVILQDAHNGGQTDSRLSEINGISVQDARLLLSDQETSQDRQGSLQHQRVNDKPNKPLSLFHVQDLQTVYLQEQPNLLQQYDNDQYTEEQTIIRNNEGTQKSQSLNQGPVMLSSDGNQPHLPKIQITIQDHEQMEQNVHGLIVSPSNNASRNNDTRHQMDLIQSSPSKSATKMYLVDVNNISAVVDSVTTSIDQSQTSVSSSENNSGLSQHYNDPQLLYQLYQQYNQNYHQ